MARNRLPDAEFGPEEYGPIAQLRQQIGKGTVTSIQSKVVLANTWCKCSVRDRGRGGGRELFLIGRKSRLDWGLQCAMMFVEANGE
eukprot:1588341-Pyramimonas_sp.AAC.1